MIHGKIDVVVAKRGQHMAFTVRLRHFVVSSYSSLAVDSRLCKHPVDEVLLLFLAVVLLVLRVLRLTCCSFACLVTFFWLQMDKVLSS